MNTFDPMVLTAIFLEMLGPLLWVLLAAAVLVPLAFGLLVARERRLVARRLVGAQAVGLLGGAGALTLMAAVSSSGFTDAGGPVDWLLVVLIFLAGMLYATLAAYAAAGWLARPRREPA